MDAQNDEKKGNWFEYTLSELGMVFLYVLGTLKIEIHKNLGFKISLNTRAISYLE